MNKSPLRQERCKLLQKRAKSCHADIVFYGDSLTHYWEKEGAESWNKYLRPLNAEAFGVEGDCTGDLQERLENGELNLAQDPRLCFLLIGTNNTTADWGKEPVETSFEGIRTIAEMILHQFPMTHLYIEQIFPRGRARHNAVRTKGEKINDMLERSNLPRTTILSHGNLILDEDGLVKKEYTTDYIHLTPQAYEKWGQALAALIRKEWDHV